jgi:hypothetical protein
VHHALPATTVEATKSLGGIPANDPAMIGDWPVSSDAARAIAALAGAEIDAEHLDYCHERDAPLPSAGSTRAAE